MASALSFSALLCLAPLTLILFSVAGYLMESDRIAKYLFDAATLLIPAYGRELGEFFSFLTDVPITPALHRVRRHDRLHGAIPRHSAVAAEAAPAAIRRLFPQPQRRRLDLPLVDAL